MAKPQSKLLPMKNAHSTESGIFLLIHGVQSEYPGWARTAHTWPAILSNELISRSGLSKF